MEGTGSGWTGRPSTGWSSVRSVSAQGWQVEFSVSYTKLNISAGSIDTVGISLWNEWTSAGDFTWPPAATSGDPDSWGVMYSSDLWLPVELVTFEGSSSGNSVVLLWTTASETNNYGFEVERSTDNIFFSMVGFVRGNGTINIPQSYTFTEEGLNPGEYYYRLKQIDSGGGFEYSDTIKITIGMLAKYNLAQNYPNPFNANTTIKYQIPKSGRVHIVIYNLLGEKIRQLAHDIKNAGYYSLRWDGKDDNGQIVSSGIYLYSITVLEYSKTKKMIFMR